MRRVVELGPPLLLGLAPLVFFGNAGEFENTPKSAFLQCGIALMALLWLGRPGVRVRSRLDLPVVLFYVTCWVSVFGAANPFEAVPLLLHWGAGVLFYFLLVHTLRGPAAVPRFLLAATLSCIAVCLIGIAQQQFGLDWIPQTEAEPASTFGNRNMAAHFVAICFPFALGLTALSANVLQRTLGAENVIEVDPTMGGEDFAFFANEVPGFYFRLGVVAPGTESGGLHTPSFRADDSAVSVGMRAMAHMVLDYLQEASR